MSDLDFVSGVELAGLIRTAELSSTEVVENFLLAIEARNPLVNAYVLVLADEAMATARAADRDLAAGLPRGPLHGVPVAIKDLFDFKAGVPASLGSRMFANLIPTSSATYVARLEAAGAIVIGKTNTPELGHKGVTDNFLFGPTRSPFDLESNAGGSSGGSAAAVAEGLAPLAQGSDGGGSVRIPASLCGVYGLKPSFGRIASVTRPNLFVKATPFLHPGPITRTVSDAALMLDVMAGPDAMDPFSLPEVTTPFLASVSAGIDGVRVAYSRDLGVFPIEQAVADEVDGAVNVLEAAGAEVDAIDVELPLDHLEMAGLWQRLIGQTYLDFFCACAEEGLDLLGGGAAGLEPDLAALVEAAVARSARQCIADEVARSRVYEVLAGVLDTYELLVLPTVSVEHLPNGTDGRTLGPRQVAGVPVDPFIGWCLTHPFNFTGHPAASVPAGLVAGRHPVGLQIVGARFRDDLVIRASAALERERPWAGWYADRRGGAGGRRAL